MGVRVWRGMMGRGRTVVCRRGVCSGGSGRGASGWRGQGVRDGCARGWGGVCVG